MTAPALPTEHDVEQVLRGVVDPELHGDIVDLGMFRGADVSADGVVTVKVALTISSCPLRGEIKSETESKVRGLPGVTDVKVEYTEMTSGERTELMQQVRWRAREQAPETEVPLNTRIIAVASGKGGVGKSSVAANLAVGLARKGLTVGVLDADIWVFSVPRMLGIWGRLGGADGKIHPHEIEVPSGVGAPGRLKVVSTGLLVEQEDSALMWRGLLLSKSLEQFLVDVAWGELDYLVIDMPPGTGDVQMALSRLLPRTEVMVVTTPNLAAQRVAARVANMAQRSYLKVLGVIENMSVFECDHGEAYELFGAGGGDDLAQQLGVPLLARIPLEPKLSAGSDAGTPVVTSSPETPAAREIQQMADRIVDELLPPVEMAGCSARMFEALGSVPTGSTPPSETAVAQPRASGVVRH